VPSAKVIHNFGRTATHWPGWSPRSRGSSTRHGTAQHSTGDRSRDTGDFEILNSRRFGGAWLLDELWERLGIGAALRECAQAPHD